MSENTRPLAGLRVLEFSHTIMGPCAGLLLADLGADVIKIEPAPDGDRTRRLTGFAAGFFPAFNRNKRSVSIDLKSGDGQRAVHTLVKGADVVLENYGPGTMERLGCGYDALSAINPGLVYLALKGYLAGPWQDRPALDEVVQFQSGLAYMTGPVGQPLRAGASVVDILGAVFGVTGVLAALRERDRTGAGQRVGSALFESAALLMSSHMVGSATSGETVPPMTARRGAWGIYDVFDTADDKALFIGVTSDAQWVRFCQVFGFADWARDPALVSNSQRTAARSWLIGDLGERLGNYTHSELIDRLQEADVSWSPVGQPEHLWHNEQLSAPDALLDIALATANASQVPSTRIPGMPLEFGTDRQRLGVYSQPPEVGQHSAMAMREAGVPDTDIELWLTQGVLYDAGHSAARM